MKITCSVLDSTFIFVIFDVKSATLLLETTIQTLFQILLLVIHRYAHHNILDKIEIKALGTSDWCIIMKTHMAQHVTKKYLIYLWFSKQDSFES